MLKVIIELHPGGNSEKAKTIAWGEIYNVYESVPGELATYKCTIYEGERGRASVRAMGEARNVKKSRGAWFVVFRCLFACLIKVGRKGPEKYVD